MLWKTCFGQKSKRAQQHNCKCWLSIQVNGFVENYGVDNKFIIAQFITEEKE